MDVDSHERCAFLSLLLLALRPELSRFEIRTDRALALFGGAELVCSDHFHMECTGPGAQIPRGLRAAHASFAFAGPGGGPREVDYAGLAQGLLNAPERERAGEATVWALQHVDPPAPGDGRILEVIAAVMAARRAGRPDSDWPPLGVVVELGCLGPVRDPVGYGTSFGMIEVRTGTYDYWHFRTRAQDPRAIELRVDRWEVGSWNIQFSSLGAYEIESGSGGESDGDYQDE